MLRRLLLTLLFVSLPAAAQPYPSQPIRLIAPFPPGGSVDIMARLISEPLGGQLGGKIVIDNRTGASGNIGMEAAARARPDGYTVVLNTIPLATNPALFDKLSWDPVRDFAPIGMVATAPHVLVIPQKVQAKTVQELVASPTHLAGGAANAALLLATAGLAYAYASKGVRVVGVSPGVTKTERVAEGLKAEAKRANISEEQAYKQMISRLPMGRPAEPEEIADIVVFAASERGRYLNGANISTDGAASHVVV